MGKYGECRYGSCKYGEDPMLCITPDLGWPHRDSMFDSLLNPKLAAFEEKDLEDTALTPAPIKGRNTLVFDFDGTIKRIPAGDLHLLGGSTRHLWRIGSGDVGAFVLSRAPLSPEPEPRTDVTIRIAHSPKIIGE